MGSVTFPLRALGFPAEVAELFPLTLGGFAAGAVVWFAPVMWGMTGRRGRAECPPIERAIGPCRDSSLPLRGPCHVALRVSPGPSTSAARLGSVVSHGSSLSLYQRHPVLVTALRRAEVWGDPAPLSPRLSVARPLVLGGLHVRVHLEPVRPFEQKLCWNRVGVTVN